MSEAKVEKDKFIFILGIVAIVAIVGIIFGLSGMNKSYKSGMPKSDASQETSEETDLAGQAGGAYRRSPTSITYMDPTKCYFGSFREYGPDGKYTIVRCKINQFVGSVTHIDCPSYADTRIIVGTAWNGDGEGPGYDTLPSDLLYACVGRDEVWRSPSQILAYCCDIQGVTVKAAIQASRASRTESGRAIVS